MGRKQGKRGRRGRRGRREAKEIGMDTFFAHPTVWFVGVEGEPRPGLLPAIAFKTHMSMMCVRVYTSKSEAQADVDLTRTRYTALLEDALLMAEGDPVDPTTIQNRIRAISEDAVRAEVYACPASEAMAALPTFVEWGADILFLDLNPLPLTVEGIRAINAHAGGVVYPEDARNVATHTLFATLCVGVSANASWEKIKAVAADPVEPEMGPHGGIMTANPTAVWPSTEGLS